MLIGPQVYRPDPVTKKDEWPPSGIFMGFNLLVTGCAVLVSALLGPFIGWRVAFTIPIGTFSALAIICVLSWILEEKMSLRIVIIKFAIGIPQIAAPLVAIIWLWMR